MKKTICALAALSLFASPSTLADDGDDNAFDLFNDSKVAATELRTQLTGGSWSPNWLKSPVKAGESRPMRFKAGDTRCEIRTKVVFADGSYYDHAVDYCSKETLIVGDEEMDTM